MQMICPKCEFEQDQRSTECLRCGIVFAKYKVAPADSGTRSEVHFEIHSHRMATFRTLLFPVSGEQEPVTIGARAALLVLLGIWSISFLFASIESNSVGESFMHLVNLPFHEAGHILFSPFGRFIQVLGGTLGQLLMPTICLAVLLVRTRDGFGAAIALWWLAESFMDIAPYINDARSLNLILLGGVTGREVADYHDWEYLLGTLGLLRMDHGLALLAHGTGIVLMVTSLVWAAANILVQFRAYRTPH
jgi:hypothetical protein